MSARVAVVTGASSDIGAAVVRALAEGGTSVVAVGRDVTALAGLPARALAVDLGAPDALALLCGVGPADIVVHAATAHPPFARAVDVAQGDLDEALRISVGGLLALAKAFAPGMRERRWGRFVAVGSVAGSTGGPGQLAYASAKSALLGAVRTLALELGPSGITANLVVPGLIDTSRTRGHVAEPVREAIAARTALRRAGTAEEVAAVVAMLASGAGGYVTGAELPVDGGLSVAAFPR